MVGLKRILNEIKKRHLVDRLYLTRGNCGCFAIALKHLLGKGDLFEIGSGFHVVLKIGRKYVDGTGIYSFTEIKDEWGPDGEINNNEKKILKDTAEYHSVKEMEEILTLLSEGKSVREFYVGRD